MQGFIQALLLTSVFHEGLRFMDVGHNPNESARWPLQLWVQGGAVKSPFGYFSTLRFSNSRSIKTQNSKSYEHVTMLKQGVKQLTLNLFEHVHYLNFLSFSCRPYATSFVGLLLSLMLMLKSTKILEASLDLTPLFKTSVYCWRRVKGLVSNVDYLENWRYNFIQNNIAEKDVYRTHKLRSLDCNFSFLYGLFTPLWLLKVKKRINKAFSKQSKQFLLLFHFLV